MTPRSPSARAAGPSVVLAALAVAVVLGDSSVVTLGLPAVLRDFGAGVSDVAWVLISFNLVLALAALPAAALVRRVGPSVVWRAGLAVFAAGSLGCALTPTLDGLVAARGVQAAGGAAVVLAALAMLVAARGPRHGVRIWGAAGVIGAALGPACGGALTQLFSWEAIFVVQVPLLLAVLVKPVAGAGAPAAAAGRPVAAAGASAAAAGRPPLALSAALALVSAALTAALFLFVLLLTEGWGRTPLAAAAIVSVIALAAVAAAPVGRLIERGLQRAAAGAVALAGGLAALGLIPGASAGWTLGPQILVGVGLGLTLYALTTRALGRDGAHLGGGAWTIAARHAGVVLGLALLTPVFTADLKDEQIAAERAGSAALLDAPLPPGLKVSLAEAITERVDRAGGQLPDLRPAFDEVDAPPAQRPALARLQARLTDELQRAATHAFSRAFLLAAALALLALVPIAIAGRSVAGGLSLLAAAAASSALLGFYVAQGGGTYKPLEVRDPCDPRPWRDVRGSEAIAEQISLASLNGAACRLRVTREELALALATTKARTRFMRERGIGDEVLAEALRGGLLRAISEAAEAGAVPALPAAVARAAIQRMPVEALIEAARSGSRVLDLLRGGGGPLDALGAALGAP